MEQFLTRPFLKAYSGLSINISAALLVVPFVGYTIELPKNLFEFSILKFDIVAATIFLLVTVWCEKRLERRK